MQQTLQTWTPRQSKPVTADVSSHCFLLSVQTADDVPGGKTREQTFAPPLSGLTPLPLVAWPHWCNVTWQGSSPRLSPRSGDFWCMMMAFIYPCNRFGKWAVIISMLYLLLLWFSFSCENESRRDWLMGRTFMPLNQILNSENTSYKIQTLVNEKTNNASKLTRR